MGTRTRADYEQVIKLAYDGYTAEGITGIMGKGHHPNTISNILSMAGTCFKEIRAAKREGKTLGAVLGSVDWSFLEKQAAVKAKRLETLQKYRPAKRMFTLSCGKSKTCWPTFTTS